MPLIHWSDRLSVGVDELDADHKRLAMMLNGLADAIQAGDGQEKLGQILDDLLDYTVVHFKNEEAVMDRTHYPDATIHKREHTELAKKAVEVQKKFTQGANGALAFEVVVFLKNWLIKHIQGSDKRLGAFVREFDRLAG